MVIANDNTVASGAWWPLTPEKIERAQNMALDLRLPVIYLVDCSGLFLPEQSRSFSGRAGAGHIFTLNARLADAGGATGRGGLRRLHRGRRLHAYRQRPRLHDRVGLHGHRRRRIDSRGQVSQADRLDIGGPEVHVHQSACADERVPDDATAIRAIREEIARLPRLRPISTGMGSSRAPRFDPAELATLFPRDFRQVYDIEQVLARLVDDSLFHEVLAESAERWWLGLGACLGFDGLYCQSSGIVDEPGIGRRAGGALYREGIAKISTFARTCHDDGIPLVWLQDIAGFDIGVEAERQGLLGYGSNLIYTNATAKARFLPCFCARRVELATTR